MNSGSRRTLLKYGLLASLTGSFSIRAYPAMAKNNFPVTPAEIEGPFYPITRLSDQDYDLTRIGDRQALAQGRHILLTGTVTDTQGSPISQAQVEIWQANAAGRYQHPYDPNPAPIDPDFQGYAIVLTDAEGAFLFRTVFPGAYPATVNWVRPPHIHFKVTHPDHIPLTTQMYFPNHPLNTSDLLLNDKNEQERALMIARPKASTGDLKVFEYFIVLKKMSMDSSSGAHGR
ncbi:protocatechuate 3,4-dioxygenase [Nitrosomonas sp. ANs5]|uniref:dioxygenase family protein n=1 Tax=Nitrosomonas sp. ANs5 TaxID=3423941 RepID=UPI003D334DD8